LDDIKTHLRKQWAALFQRLLKEQRGKVQEEKQINYLSEQIADLKTAIVTSISNTELANTARGAIKYRQLISFLSLIYREKDDLIEVLKTNVDWDDLLYSLNVIGIVKISDLQDRRHLGLAIVLGNGTYFETTYNYQVFEEFIRKWSGFRILKETQKLAIINAIIDDVDDIMASPFARYVNEDFFLLLHEDVFQKVIFFHWSSVKDWY
jgi:hypothetical protein